MKGLYVHIPFCQYICHYCDFVKMVAKNESIIDNYLDHLIIELNTYQAHFKTITTIFIGGGTPSMLTDVQLEKLLKALYVIKPVEFSIEINPDSYTHTKGVILKKYGVNRISIGVQTFNENLLKYLNRQHTQSMVETCFNDLRALGFNDISLDLIFAIPGQTLKNIESDLKMVDQLNPEHLSYYSLILEDKTYFYHQYLRNKFEPLSEDQAAIFYNYIRDHLISNGYEHYEISNFTKNNHHSLHNILYWTLGEYIGIGLGACGFIDGKRTYNQRSITQYMKIPLKESIIQTPADNLQDTLIFGLRLIKGVNVSAINTQYNVDIFEKYPKINEYLKDEILLYEDGYLRLSKKGVLLGNQVFMIFI